MTASFQGISERYGFLELATRVDKATLCQLMMQGKAPEFSDLVGWEYAGINTAAAAHWFGFGKFKKGFYQGVPRVSHGPEPYIQGYNVVVHQNGLKEPHRAMPDEDHPKRHGFFRVHAVVSGARDARYPNALLLDYGLGRNGLLPSAVLRDYVVQVYEDDASLLLGEADLALGPLRIPAGFFVLNRQNRHNFKG